MDYFSPAAITDGSGNVTERYAFSAFGVRSILTPDFSPRSTSECTWEFGFQGQFLDTESGFYDYGYRYYSPSLGRWLSKDPIAEQGGLNLYAFAENNGVNAVDFLGLDTATYAAFEMVPSDGHTENTIVGIIKLKTRIDTSECRYDAAGSCTGKAKVFLDFRWMGIYWNSDNTPGEGGGINRMEGIAVPYLSTKDRRTAMRWSGFLLPNGERIPVFSFVSGELEVGEIDCCGQFKSWVVDAGMAWEDADVVVYQIQVLGAVNKCGEDGKTLIRMLQMGPDTPRNWHGVRYFGK